MSVSDMLVTIDNMSVLAEWNQIVPSNGIWPYILIVGYA